MTFKEILDEVIKIKIKTPEKFQKVAKYVRNHFKYVISSIFILFSWVYQWCIIAFKQDSKSNDFETIKTIFDFFLSYILVTSLKDYLEKWIRGKFYRFKSFNKETIIIIPIIVILMLSVLIIFAPLFFKIIGIIVLIPLLISVFIFFFSNDTEELLESFGLTFIFILIGIIITIFFIYIPIIPNFNSNKFIYKYLFIVFTEIFKLTDQKSNNIEKPKKYIKVIKNENIK